MTGIENTREVVTLATKSVRAYKQAMADGKLSWIDLGQLATVFPSLLPAIEDVDQVIVEIQDLDASELDVLRNDVVDIVGEFSSDDELLQFIELALKWAKSTYDLFISGKELFTE